MGALNNELVLCVVLGARRTDCQTRARSALRVAVLPFRLYARVRRAAHDADNTPLALPRALRDAVQRRIKTVDVIADVTLVTEDEATLVVRFTAPLAHGAVQTAPSFL